MSKLGDAASHSETHDIVGGDHLGFPGGTTSFLRGDATFAVPPGGGSGGYEDLALWKVYTLDKTPNSTYPDFNAAKNGSSEKGLLTSEGFIPGPDTGFATGLIGGRRATELTADGKWKIRVDLGSAMTVNVARAVGFWDTSNQIYHPEEFTVEYSSDDSSWTTFGSALTGMGTNPGTLNTAFWKCEASGSQSARYWRFTLKAGTGGGDDWLFVGRVRLLGVR